MAVAVCHVSSNNQIEVWHVQHRGVVRVALADLNCLKRMTFEIKSSILWEHFRRIRDIGYLASREEWTPIQKQRIQVRIAAAYGRKRPSSPQFERQGNVAG